ncbi:muscarinic acetylcholine receptor M2 [Hoplias malabaricus]|uniref:muscarinic acetylcholine receptor M2 n=1 Tax=Hoplias malabaricus TaxID=27720 RepID=UPI0034633349
MNFTNFTIHDGSQNYTNVSSPKGYTLPEQVLVVLGLSALSLITIIGNILVIVSIKVNKNLQTVNNYFLFSLACADLIIGLFSMNLYTVYIVTGHWPLGPVVCDLWLALDYVASNASVMNLLIISFDRYFCVTKPLTYPVQRTTKMAGLMIAAAWILSFILWAPAILFWQFIVGKRTLKMNECKIQFFSNAAVTFGTAIAAFYLPVVIMSVLYWQISKASRSRMRRERGRVCGTGQDTRIQPMSSSEGSEARTQSQRIEDMVRAGQHSGSDATTGEDRESENDSTSDSVMASSNQRGEDVSVETNGIKSCPAKTSSQVKASWAKLTCFTASRKGGDSRYEPASANEKTNNRKERQRLMALILMHPHKKKRKSMSSRERKVTRTIMAILVAFVVTWTPYNVMVLINTFCDSCIPDSMWVFGYWLCYINSTVNPACYALCNVTFKNTFKQLLMCKYKNIRTIR